MIPTAPRRGRRARRRRRSGGALLLMLLPAAGCSSAAAPAPGAPARTDAGAGPPPVAAAGMSAAAVTDAAGDRFTVEAAPARSLPVVTVHGALWSAAPGHGFLEARLEVTNPTAGTESLRPFDDPTTGLATAVDFVLGAADATRLGDGADCGADPVYPATVCPISFPQRLTVDDDSADTGGPEVVLAPGATATVTYSFGPVPSAVASSTVSLWFAGSPAPVDLTP